MGDYMGVGLTLFVQLDLDQARPIPTMPEIKVTYFNLRVRGEPIRLLLAYGDLPYEDIRPLPPWEDKEGWAKMKPTLPYGQLPKLEWDGQSIYTCLAGCRFIAHHLGLMGKTTLEHAQVDEIVDVIEDTLNAGYRAILTEDPAEKEKLLETHKTKTIPVMLENMEKRNGKGRSVLCRQSNDLGGYPDVFLL